MRDKRVLCLFLYVKIEEFQEKLLRKEITV